MPYLSARPSFCPTVFLRLLLWVFLIGFVPLASAQALQPIPPLTARVTDQTGTLTQTQRGLLEAKLANFERQKGAQIAVLLVPTVKPESIEQYSLRVVEAWKLGRKGVDDGALLIVAREDRKLRIEVGYGLEGALNDATAKRIISETITPRFKQGDFAGGIEAGVDAMLKVVGGETLPPPATATATATGSSVTAGFDFETWLALGFVFIFVIGGILRAIFGRFLASTIIGVAAGFIASLFMASLLFSGLIGMGAFILSLLIGKGRSSGGHWSSPSWSSSSGGFGGSSDSGGFSGGGGDFGGGGASGDW